MLGLAILAGGRPAGTPTLIATLTANRAFVRLTATPVGPSKLMAVPGNGLAVLSWIPPPGATSATTYSVFEGTTSGGESTTPVSGSDVTNCTASATAASCTVTGLTNGNTYYFKVAVAYRPGSVFFAIPLSNEASAALFVPGAPTGLTATASNGQATLSWNAPASNGGPLVTGYDVYDATTNDFSERTEVTTTAGTSITVPLANNATYYFWVTAVNTIGPGPASSPTSAALFVPGAPTGLNAMASNGLVSLSWTAAASNGGPPITGYDVYRSTTSGFSAGTPITTTASTSTSVTGPPPGTTYYFWVTAANAIGQSDPSNQAPVTTSVAPGVPGAPTGLTAMASNGQVSLSWIAPASNGGSPVTGYDVYRTTTSGSSAGTLITTTASTITSTSVTGLTNGTTYYFWVTAANTVGPGPASNQASATPIKAKPTLLVAILAAIAALAVAGAVTLVRRGRRRRPPSPRHVPPASDVRAVPGSRLPDEVDVRETGREPTHTVLFEPDGGTTTTTIKELT